MTRVGIAGHQRLDDARAWGWVEAATRAELERLEPPLVGVTCLAIGSDQLFARLVLERGGTLHAVLPYTDIVRSFASEDLPTYQALVAQAHVEVLDTRGTDEDAYLAAGYRVADLSNLLLAVWDGKPARGKGGTADVVAYAIARGVPVVQIDPDSRQVRSIREQSELMSR